jgi:type I restriction enzyme S subunit
MAPTNPALPTSTRTHEQFECVRVKHNGITNFVKLSDVCKINPRASVSLKKDLNQPVSFLSMSTVLESGITQGIEEKAIKDVLKGYTYFERGDVLLAKITPCMENGKATYLENLPHQVGFGSTEFHVLRPTQSIDGKYLFYLLWNSSFRHVAQKNMTGSAGQKRVPTSFLSSYKIPLPPLPEQRRIAAILDRADALRRKRRQSIALLDEFLRATFLDMFGDPVTNPKGWPEQNLQDIALIVSGVTKGRKFKDKETVEVPYMRVANVQDGHIQLDEIKKIEVLPSDVTKYQLQKGDILLTEGGDPDKLGRGAVWNGQISPCIHQNHIFRVRIKNRAVVPEYLSLQIASARGKRYFLKAAKQTTGIASINMRQLKSFPVLIPPLALQEEFAERKRIIEKTGFKYIQSANELDAQFNALVQRAFKGEL